MTKSSQTGVSQASLATASPRCLLTKQVPEPTADLLTHSLRGSSLGSHFPPAAKLILIQPSLRTLALA